MKLRETLTPHEREQLQSVMKHEPLWPGDTLSHDDARRLADRGLIRRDGSGNWIACWETIRDYPRGG